MGKRYYDNYDYEEAYKEQCKKLEEIRHKRSGGNMVERKKRIARI